MSTDEPEVWSSTPPPAARAAAPVDAPNAEQWSTRSPPGENTPAPQSWSEYAKNLVMSGAIAGGFGLPNRAVAAKRTLTGEAPSYSEALDSVNAEHAQFKKENPWANVVPETVGSAATGLGVGGLAAKALPKLYSGATSVLQRMGLGAAEGATLGGLQGAGTTYSGIPSDYAKNFGMGTVFGAGVGAVAPAAGAVGGAAYRAAADRGWGSGIPSNLARAAQADEAGVRNLVNVPGSMLPDAGPSMLGTAQGAVLGTGGRGRTALVTALRDRDNETARRIVSEVDNTFGPARTPSHVEAGIQGRMGELGPAYEHAINNARAIDPEPMALWLEGQIGNTRGPAQTALRQVRSMLDVPTNAGVLDPHPRALQAARTAVRGMQTDATDPAVRGALEHVEAQMTRELQAKVPGIRELDSQYAELGTQQRASQTSSAGARIFDTGRNTVARPVELAETMNEAVQPKGVNVGPSAEGFRLREAARSELDRIVGTNRNDLAKLEQVLGQPQDWNAQKLALMFGEDRAQRLVDVLSRERGFRQTYQDVVQGTQTAQRETARKQLDAGEGKVPLQVSALGLLGRGAQGVWDTMRKTASEAQRDRIAAFMAARDPATIQSNVTRLLEATPQRDMRQELIRRLIQQGATGVGAANVSARE